MARITRVTAIPFGLTGTTDDFETFGSTAAGGTDYSKDIAAIQATAAWQSGWRAALIASKAPVLQDMNGKMLVDSNLICYLFQEGVPEYDSGSTYYKGGVVKNLANSGYIEFYASLVDTNTGNALPTRVSNGNWLFLYAINTTAQGLITPGTITNDSAAAGDVGEYIPSVVGTTNFPATTVFGDLTSIALTPGDWDVTAIMAVDNLASVTNVVMGISPNSGNSTTGLVLGSNRVAILPPTSGSSTSGSIPNYRVSIASGATYYLKYSASYSGSIPTAEGRLSARRVR